MFEINSKIRYLLVIILLLIIFFIGERYFKGLEDKPGDYFPDAQMVKKFKGNLDGDEFTQIIDKIKGHKLQIKQVDNQTKVAMVYDVTKDMIRLVYTTEVTDDFKDDYITYLKENRDHTIMKAPLSIGSSWKDDIGGEYNIIEVDSIVRTPAGKFETMVITYKNHDFNVKEYYAKNIGLVKIVINNYLVNELVELKIEN